VNNHSVNTRDSSLLNIDSFCMIHFVRHRNVNKFNSKEQDKRYCYVIYNSI